jgi:hypothetical protein
VGTRWREYPPSCGLVDDAFGEANKYAEQEYRCRPQQVMRSTTWLIIAYGVLRIDRKECTPNVGSLRSLAPAIPMMKTPKAC